MIAYERGNIVLVSFVFSDESGAKRRPALIISSDAYHRARQDVIVSAITSNTRRRVFGDHIIADWKSAGLLYPSVATGILRTIKETMIARRLGSMTEPDLEAIDRGLRRALRL